MYKLLAFALSSLFSLGLIATFGWWVVLVPFGLAFLTLLLSTAQEGAERDGHLLAGTQPAAL